MAAFGSVRPRPSYTPDNTRVSKPNTIRGFDNSPIELAAKLNCELEALARSGAFAGTGR